MHVGTDLRQARLRAGLTTVQVSERTKIQLHKIEALENGTYENLPSGVHLDGLVHAYARAVGLPAEGLVERARQERLASSGWPVSPADLEAFRSEHHGPAEQTPAPVPDVEPQEMRIQLGRTRSVTFEHTRAVAPPPSRRRNADPFRDLPTRLPRHAARRSSGRNLVIVSMLALAGWGAYLYQAAGWRRAVAPPPPVVSQPPEDAREVSPSVEHRQETPPIDIRLPADDRASTAGAERSTAAISPGTADRKPAPQPGQTPAQLASTRDLSGSWTFATRVESSRLARYSGLELGYELELRQSGSRVTGAGRKVVENDKEVGGRAQTPIIVNGSIDGDRVTLTFTERGTLRPTRGSFMLVLDDQGAMQGRFSSTAAKSSGTVEARRRQPGGSGSPGL